MTPDTISERKTGSSRDDMIDFRLTSIEKTLSELKDVMLENKMQARDIQELNKQQRELIDAINAHEKRIRDNENDIKDLKNRPVQEKAQKWQFIMDYLFKAVVAIAAGILLAKIGLN